MHKSRDRIKPLFLRYLVVGVGSYMLELIILFGLHDYAHFSGTLSTAISFWFGLSTAFILQKMVAFKDARNSAKALSRQIIAYAFLTTFNYLITLSIVSLGSEHMLLVSRTFALGCTTSWNFFIYRHIFRIKNPEIAA